MSKNDTSIAYSLHELGADMHLRNFWSEFGAKRAKSIKRSELYATQVENSAMTGDQLPFSIAINEYYWEKESKRVLFPKSAADIMSIFEAPEAQAEDAKFVLPYDSFMVALPEGFEFEGEVIPPFLVSFIAKAESRKKLFAPILKLAGLSEFHKVDLSEEVARGDSLLSINYQDYNVNGASVLFSRAASKLPIYRKCKTPEDLEDRTQVIVDEAMGVMLDDVDFKVQFFMVKFVLALGTHFAINGVKSVQFGYPTAKPPRMAPLSSAYSISASTLSYVAEADQANNIL